MTNLELAIQFCDYLESHDVAGVQTLLADDFTAKGPSRQLTKEQTLGFLKILFIAFPDHSFGLGDLRQEGESILCRSHECGTHTGILDLKPFGLPVSLPPTGKPFRLPGSTLTIRVQNEKVAYFGEESVPGGGLAGILEQLGVRLPGA